MLDLRLIVVAEDLMIDDEPSNEIHSKFPSALGTTLGTNISDRLYRLIHRESANSRNIIGCEFGYFPCRKVMCLPIEAILLSTAIQMEMMES